MEKEGRCWRKEVDEKLQRLHSLLFGADLALECRDYEIAHTLGLSLLGFLDSTSLTHADESLTRSIRRDAASKVEQARRALTPDSDCNTTLASRVEETKGETEQRGS